MNLSGPPRLTLLFREGCHLCEDLELQLAELLPAESYELHRIDIDQDDALRERWNDLVPVLLHDGEVLCEHFLDLQAVTGVLSGYNTGLPTD